MHLRVAAFAAAVLLLATACTAPQPAAPPISPPPPPKPAAPPPARGWVTYQPGMTIPAFPELGMGGVGAPDWRDDASADSLTGAIGQSLAYYRQLPPDTEFTFAGLSYSAVDMAHSLELFLSLRLTTPDPEAFAATLRENFLVLESIADDGANLFTGYYEPRIPGSQTPTPTLSAPIYARPPDLVEVDLSDFGKDLPPRRVVGRVQDGRLVPYYSRQEIQQGRVLEGRAKALAYVNLVDLFFLQIQGSGQVVLPDGSVLSVGYEASNGQPYRALGAELIRRNLMAQDEVSLFTLKTYLAEHQDVAPLLLNTNPSYVFFHKLDDGRGPLGNLREPLTPGRSIATDRLLLPPGALAYVMTTVPEPNQPGVVRDVQRFMLIQDTGGAIRGHGRGDLFWGSGPDAEWMAANAKQPGRIFVLVAKKEALPPPEAPASPQPAKAAPPPAGAPIQARIP